MKLDKFLFYFLLILISFLGLLLRFRDYDRIPPFGETQDEFFYPWAGMTLLQKGVPVAWSLFPSYGKREYLSKWGINYPIVSPWVEKPPLYSLITGGLVTLKGAKKLEDVRLSVVRLMPVTLSFFTIFLIGLLATEIFNKEIGLLSSVLYATVPTIVMANRMSLVENLMTPLMLLTLYLFALKNDSSKWNTFKPYFLGLISGLVVITKNIGIALPLVIFLIFLFQKKWKETFIFGLISVLFVLIHPLMGAYYGWNLFINVLRDYQEAHALVGIPELVQTIFRFPVVGHKDKIFLDGAMLAGYALLFSAPFWLKMKNSLAFLGFPFVYVTLLALLESGGTDFSYFGWHVYPLFPFLMILLAKVLYDLWQEPNLLQLLFFYLTLGLSTVRFFLLIRPELQRSWQGILALFLLILAGGFIFKTAYQRIVLAVLFVIFLIVNVLVVTNLNQIYPGFPQPLQ